MLPIISCEHASKAVPETLVQLFDPHRELVDSHRGFDIGAGEFAVLLADALKVPLHLAPFSRLVVDCNRSLTHPCLFSAVTRDLPPLAREAVLAEHYHPYRQAVFKSVEKTIQRKGCCLHIGVHSFTPSLEGKERTAEIGLLYDPARTPESAFCRKIGKAFRERLPEFRIRCNYPYRGVSDGLIPALRKSFDLPAQYIGIELELNQKLYDPGKTGWPRSLSRQFLQLLERLVGRKQ